MLPPELDPRRNPLLNKDLRALAASVLVDAGATTLEASKLLRHKEYRTTLEHCARAQEEFAFDEDRVGLLEATELKLGERLVR